MNIMSFKEIKKLDFLDKFYLFGIIICSLITIFFFITMVAYIFNF